MKVIFFMSILLFVFAWSQESSLDEELFGGGDSTGDEESIVSEVEDDPESNLADELLASEKIAIGGTLTIDGEVSLDLDSDSEDSLSSGFTDFKARLYLDARPNSDLRAFVKGDIVYDTSDGVSFDLREMFADVGISDTVFLRAGKQTINWGVGFFFSPANIINLENIDPEDPKEELAGPVAFKAQLPLGTSNLSGYLLLDEIEEDNPVAFASRYEFLLDSMEITVGGVYQYDNPWSVMVTGTRNFGDIGFFAEAVLEGNSNKVFLVEDSSKPSGIGTETRPDKLFLSGTIGGNYSYTTDDDMFSVALTAQYFYNGLGYSDSSLYTKNPAALTTLIEQGALSFSDLRERGQHYGAARVSFNNIVDTDLTPSLLWIGNLNDGSGIVDISLRYSGIDNLTPSISYKYNYGVEGSEYSNSGSGHSLTAGLAINAVF